MTWEERLSKDAFAQAANMAKQAMTIKYQIAEAEEREVTAEMKKEWEKETRLYTWRKDGEVVARRLSPKNELPLKAEKA